MGYIKGKIAVNIEFSNLSTANTADGNISRYATEAKMTLDIGFVYLCTAVATVCGIYN